MHRWSSILPLLIITSLLTLLTGCSNGGEDTLPHVSGPYLGQTPPGDEPVLFAPGIVSTHLYNRDLVMTPDVGEVWFGFGAGGMFGIAVTKKVQRGWTEPEIAPFSDYPLYGVLEPALSPDGNRIYFLSDRPPPGREDEYRPGTWGFQNIWYSDRTAGGWTEPEIVPPPVNTDEAEYYPSLTREGVLYFTRSSQGKATTMRAEPEGDFFGEPVPLEADWNREKSTYNCFIDPDELFILFCMAPEGSIGDVDYWVSFRGAGNTWSEPVNMGEKVNLPGARATSASLSPDGRFYFFATSPPALRDLMSGPRATLQEVMTSFRTPENGNPSIYWMDAGFIGGLRPAGFNAPRDEGGN